MVEDLPRTLASPELLEEEPPSASPVSHLNGKLAKDLL
jgi:hypothetical protein